MKETLKNRFQCFLKGMGSVLDIYPGNKYSSFGGKADTEVPYGDWVEIGQDFRNIFREVEKGEYV